MASMRAVERQRARAKRPAGSGDGLLDSGLDDRACSPRQHFSATGSVRRVGVHPARGGNQHGFGGRYGSVHRFQGAQAHRRRRMRRRRPDTPAPESPRRGLHLSRRLNSHFRRISHPGRYALPSPRCGPRLVVRPITTGVAAHPRRRAHRASDGYGVALDGRRVRSNTVDAALPLTSSHPGAVPGRFPWAARMPWGPPPGPRRM